MAAVGFGLKRPPQRPLMADAISDQAMPRPVPGCFMDENIKDDVFHTLGVPGHAFPSGEASR
jgi:hypothetical protein